MTGPPRTCVRPLPSSSISNWPHVCECQFDRLPFGNRSRVVRILVASAADGVPPMKLLVWPTTQMGAATANRIVSSFTRVIVVSLFLSKGRTRLLARADTWVGPYVLSRRGGPYVLSRRGGPVCPPRRIYRVTVTVTLSYVKTAPSLATA